MHMPALNTRYRRVAISFHEGTSSMRESHWGRCGSTRGDRMEMAVDHEILDTGEGKTLGIDDHKQAGTFKTGTTDKLWQTTASTTDTDDVNF